MNGMVTTNAAQAPTTLPAPARTMLVKTVVASTMLSATNRPKLVRGRNGMLPLSSLTEKDRRDLEWAMKQDVDYIALSFVRQGQDCREVREMINKLTINYNRTRQANITKELIEIISGAEAL